MQFRHKSIKNTIQLLVISFFLTAGVCDIFAKERSSEFDLKDGMLLQIPGQKQSILLPRIGKSIPIQWNPWESKYVTLVFPGRISLPEFKRLSVIAYFRAPADTPVRRISLRLIDKNHENFQISQVPVIQEDGSIKMVWNIGADSSFHSWGGDENQHLDQPIKIHGFSIDYAARKEPARLELISVGTQIIEKEEVSAERTLYHFDAGESFRVQSGAGKLHYTDNRLQISDINGQCIILERRDSVRLLHTLPQKMKIKIELLSGQLSLALKFLDSANRVLQTPELSLKQGKNSLEFNLSSIFKGARLPCRLAGFVFSCNGKSLGTARLLRGTLVTAEPFAESLDLNIVTGNLVPVLKRGEEDKFCLDFRNCANRTGNFTVGLEFRNFFGETFREQVTFHLKPQEKASYIPIQRFQRLGHWEVIAEIAESTEPGYKSRKKDSFAYLIPAGPTPGRANGFLFGICNNSASWSWGEQQKGIIAAALCGAKIIRNSFEWQRLQPDPEHWNFSLLDSLVKRHLDAGIELQGFLGFTPRWAAAPDLRHAADWKYWNRSAPDLNAWCNYVKTVLLRYRKQIRYWEVWNEPDLTGFNRMSLEEYVALLQNTGRIAEQIAPEVRIMTGGFATMNYHAGSKSATFQRDCLKLAHGSFQVHAYHEHGSFERFRNAVDKKFLPIRRETNTQVPWYANETAVSSMNGTERNQAITLFKKLIFAWARGAIGYNWYNLRNDGNDPMNAEHNYGMMRMDFQPKPVYSVFNMLAGTFRNMKFVRTLELGKDTLAFLFSDGNDILVPVWSESASGNMLSIALRTDADAVSSIDIMGNMEEQKGENGMALLNVTPMPTVLKLSGADNVEPVGKLLEAMPSRAAVPGRNIRLTCRLFNPFPQKRVFQLKINNMPPEFQCQELEKSVTIAPFQNTVIPFDLFVSPACRPRYGEGRQLELVSLLPEISWQCRLQVPIPFAVVIPPHQNNSRKPDFQLGRLEQVVSLTAADPALAHRNWRGPGDLSADLFLCNDSNCLKLRILVTDDKHVQPYSGFSMWKGDSIQLALQVPGQQGYWELGLSRNNSGASEIFTYQVPADFASTTTKQMNLMTTRNGTQTRYELSVPFRSIGLTPEIMRSGFRFNLLVNDNDGEGRDGWIHITPGIGENKNPDQFPYILFE